MLSIKKSRVRSALLGTAAVGVVLVTAACGASTTPPGSTTSAAASGATSAASSGASGGEEAPSPLNLNLAKVDSLNAMLPDKLKQSGTIIVATDPSYPPNEFMPDGRPHRSAWTSTWPTPSARCSA